MKQKFIEIVNRMVLPLSFITICFSIFRDYINMIPYYCLFPIRIILLLGAVAMVILGIIKPASNSGDAILKGKNLKEYLYLNSYVIIEKLFVWYFCLYVILRLDKVSVIFSFFMLLIFGIFYGYRIANIVHTRYNK